MNLLSDAQVGVPIRFAVLPPDGDIRVEVSRLTGTVAHGIIGGAFEQRVLPNVVVLSASEPRSGDPYNWAATRLLESTLLPGVKVFGTCVLTGAPDENGKPSDLPEEVYAKVRGWFDARH
jgi:hypothetical protein